MVSKCRSSTVKTSGSQRYLFKISMALTTICVAAVAVEIMLQVVTTRPEGYYVWPPGLSWISHPDEEVTPGIHRPSRFEVNSRGVRGDPLDANHDFVVLTVGGSTTICRQLDQDKAWPKALQDLLNDSQDDRRAWVGNAGRSGHSTRENILQVEQLLENFPECDVLVLLVGANDLGLRLKRDDDYSPDFMLAEDNRTKLIERAFRIYPAEVGPAIPFYKRLEIYRRLSTAKNLLLAPEGPVSFYDQWRANRKNAARLRKKLPNMGPALEEYRRNIERIIDSAQAKKVHLIALTQPTLWREDLPSDARNLLWWGGVGDFKKEGTRADFYSISAMRRGMEMYNDVLRKTCRSRGVECVGLATLIPRDPSNFYDDMHFTEEGSLLVARVVKEFMIQNWSRLTDPSRS